VATRISFLAAAHPFSSIQRKAISMGPPSELTSLASEDDLANQAQKERMKKILKSQMQVLVQANRRAEKEVSN
jgi:hypothetical protein